MLASLRRVADRWLGQGSAAITVPVMDGTLLPNRALDNAPVLAELPGIDDLASDGQSLWASAGAVLWRWDGDQFSEAARFDADISALAAEPGSGRLAVALAGRSVRLLGPGLNELQRLDSLAGQPLVCANALVFEAAGRLLLTDGSNQHGPDRWCHDLMGLGHSGRAGAWQLATGQTELLAKDLAFAYGVLPRPGGVLVSQSWHHRLTCIGAGSSADLTPELPAYPSRMAPAAAGGFWLCCFVSRSQLVEFVLREPAYRQRMVAEIDPRHWIAPALSAGHSFLEPLQGAGVKNMGVMKPWAPPRAYGLVLRVADDGRVLQSLHSQVDGRHHGITAVAELAGRLYVASKGSGRLLGLNLEATP